MKQLSLRIRSILLAMGVLALFAPLTVVILDDAYTTSLTQAKMSELRLMNLGLLSAFELDGDIPFMPEILYEEQLNLPGSGYLGVIVFRGGKREKHEEKKKTRTKGKRRGKNQDRKKEEIKAERKR